MRIARTILAELPIAKEQAARRERDAFERYLYFAEAAGIPRATARAYWRQPTGPKLPDSWVVYGSKTPHI